MIEDQGLPALTVVLTKLHAGGKFGGDGYKVSGGLHGVGVSVVNALSEWLIAEVRRDGMLYRQEFARGVPQGDMETVGPAEGHGTTIKFLPDREIFEETEFSASTLAQHLRETAFLTRAFRIVLRDERPAGTTQEFHYEGGIKDFVSYINESKDPVHKHVIYFEGESELGNVEVAMQWNTSYVESIFTFANNINTAEGGSHLSGFKAALTGTLNKYAKDKGILKEKDDNLEGEDVREGLATVISVKLRDPAVRGPDEVEARESVGARPRRADRQPEARRVPRGEPRRGAPDHHEGRLRLPRPPGGPEGARADAPQERARELLAARQARRLLAQGPRPL